jgi:hypothetical protein
MLWIDSVHVFTPRYMIASSRVIGLSGTSAVDTSSSIFPSRTKRAFSRIQLLRVRVRLAGTSDVMSCHLPFEKAMKSNGTHV